MNDSGHVGCRESGRHLPQQRQNLLLAHWAVATEPLEQRLAIEQLHGHEDHVVALYRAMSEQVEESANVRVGDLARESNFAAESLNDARLLRDLDAYGLE